MRAVQAGLCRVSVVVAAALMAVAVASAAQAAVAIRPRQHFAGVVNGQLRNATVFTVCAGPATGAPGPVAGGQTLSVRHVRAGVGYTGSFSNIYAWFVRNATVNGPLAVKFTRYGTAVSIPSGVRVPCDGRGRVEFSSCPYLAPCAAGWVPTYVGVRFVNIAD
jgi:hypothetical protein